MYVAIHTHFIFTKLDRSHKCYPYGSDESQLSNPEAGVGQPVYPSSEAKEIEIYKSQD